MKRTMLTHFGKGILIAGLATAGYLVVPGSWAAEHSNPEQLKAEAREQENRARELKTQGRHDEAREAMRKSEELRSHAEQGGFEPRRTEEQLAQRRHELARLLQSQTIQLDNLTQAGRMDQAAEVKEQLQQTERALRECDEKLMAARESRKLSPDERWLMERSQNQEELERRSHHLDMAIDNLQAAGMHQLAQELAAENEEVRRQIAGMQSPPPPRKPAPQVEQLRNEVRELQKTVRALNEQIQELRNQIKR